MLVTMLKGKIHRAVVKQAELNYVGSITVDKELMEAAGIYEYEYVQIVDVENGNRFGDHIIIMAYAQMTPEEVSKHKPNVVFVDADNQIQKVANYEKYGVLSPY